ncbi:hypothetical protein LRS05_06670 [Flavobacterium sp. J372]|nr:hypothetical protein [Flavobacterium sp. J372]
MFTTGQLVFAVLFIIVFIGVMVYVYRQDAILHKKYYKGSYWILIGFIIFILALFFIKTYLKH